MRQQSCWDIKKVEEIGVHEVTVSEDGAGEELSELPGFRFHPTDEELVRFYLRRKVNKKAFSLEIIKEIDIYKYDPWDLPKAIAAGEKEWYFFCLRGRKYKNSIRPNRVTGSGFWKATGIDRPVYSGSTAGDCIGLKKSLVYYRGSAGKGTKTDWMMHEFRLPSSTTSNTDNISPSMQEAEIWTICRIFKRDVSYKKHAEKWKETTNRAAVPAESSSQASSLVASYTSNPGHGEMKQLCDHQSYSNDQEMKINQVWPYAVSQWESDRDQEMKINQVRPYAAGQWESDRYSSLSSVTQAPMMAAASDSNVVVTPDINDLFSEENCNWDEFGSIMDLMADHSTVTYDYLYA